MANTDNLGNCSQEPIPCCNYMRTLTWIRHTPQSTPLMGCNVPRSDGITSAHVWLAWRSSRPPRPTSHFRSERSDSPSINTIKKTPPEGWHPKFCIFFLTTCFLISTGHFVDKGTAVRESSPLFMSSYQDSPRALLQEGSTSSEKNLL